MTRVEKYREYRKEILNSFYFEKEDTKKARASKKVSDATLNKDTAYDLSVDEVMEAYTLYEEKEETTKKKHLTAYEKKQLWFLIGGIALAVVLLTALIIVGIFAFR